MKWLINILLLLALGCAGTDGARRDASKAVASSDAKLTQAAAVNVAATAMALKSAPNTNLAVKVATEFNTKAALLLPTPPYASAREYQQIVTGLQRPDPKEREKAQTLLDARDAAIEALQNQRNVEAARLAELEQKLIEMGDQYEKERNKSWWSRIYATLGFGGLIALCIAFPVAVPILGNLLGGLINAVPSLASAVGLVSRKAFDSVVTAVQKSKEKMAAGGHTDALSLLKDELARDPVTRHSNLIADRKGDLGL